MWSFNRATPFWCHDMDRSLQYLCAAALTGVFMAGAQAQQSVSLSATVERIENPGLNLVSPGGVTVLRVTPGYAYELQGDRSSSRLSLGAVVERSSNTALLASREYPNLDYLWRYTWPDARLALRAGLAESATRNTEFEDAGRVTVDSKERTVTAGADWSQDLSARTQLAVNATHARVSYDSALLDGYQEQKILSRLSWEAVERTSFFFEPGYSHLSPSGNLATSSQFRWTLGMNTDLAPELSLRVFAGRARLEAPVASNGSLGGLHLVYTGRRISSDLEWTKDATASGVSALYVNTRTLRLRVGYQITEDSTITASWSRAQSSGSSVSRGTEARLTLESQLSSNLASTVGVEERRSSSPASDTAKGWAVRAGLSYAYPGR